MTFILTGRDCRSVITTTSGWLYRFCDTVDFTLAIVQTPVHGTEELAYVRARATSANPTVFTFISCSCEMRTTCLYRPGRQGWPQARPHCTPDRTRSKGQFTYRIETIHCFLSGPQETFHC